MTATDCPRCGKSPVEITRMEDAEPRYIAACTCYPHPPLCVSCRSVLTDDGRCDDIACAVFDVLQPAPITDPLWKDVAP